MSKSKARDNDRRAIVEQLRKEQERKERRRGLLILGGSAVVVLGLLAAALIPYLQQTRENRKLAGTPVSEIGASESAADCSPVQKEKATGNNEHLQAPQKIDYPQGPPASGPHWGNFLQGSEIRSFYSVQDRPEVERLVHSLEHGHTILWYDETVKPGTDAYDDVKALADKLDTYFMAAPWLASDGPAFPEGKHVALTHWTGSDEQQGITQYCAAPSGKVVADFMVEYPASDAPEPGAP